MASLDKVVKQRMVGALVLVALAVIFLPMLFSREDELRQVQVEAPEAPGMPNLPQVQVEPVQVPEPQPLPDEPVAVQQVPALSAPSTPVAQVSTPVPAPAPAPASTPVPVPTAPKPVAPAAPPVSKPAPAPDPVAAVAAAKPVAPSKVDVNGLPVSWSVQLASLSNRASADTLQKTDRKSVV